MKTSKAARELRVRPVSSHWSALKEWVDVDGALRGTWHWLKYLPGHHRTRQEMISGFKPEVFILIDHITGDPGLHYRVTWVTGARQTTGRRLGNVEFFVSTRRKARQAARIFARSEVR